MKLIEENCSEDLLSHLSLTSDSYLWVEQTIQAGENILESDSDRNKMENSHKTRQKR